MYDFLDGMKKDIKHWWKTNMSEWKLDKEVVKKFKEIVFHEIIHYKIVKTSAETVDIILYFERAEGYKTGFYYEAVCKYTFPYKFNSPKYYPRFVFIHFKHFIFDFICDLFSFAIFTTFKYRLFEFLKRLICFKVRS